MADDTYYTLKRSTRPGKKWMVRVPTSSGRGKVVHFGDSTMQDFTQHKDTARRERYWSRHQRDNLDDPGSPGFWSWHALWGQSSNLKTAFAAAVRKAKKLGGAKRNPSEEVFIEKGTLLFHGTHKKDWAPKEGVFFTPLKEMASKYGTHLYAIKAVKKAGPFVFARSGDEIVEFAGQDPDELTAGEVVDFFVDVVSAAREAGEAPPFSGFVVKRSNNDIEVLIADLSMFELVPLENPEASALHDRFAELCDHVGVQAALVIDEDTALAGRDPRSPRAFAATDGDTVFVRPKLAEQKVERIDGVLMHEIGHVILIQSGCEDHTERECDACAEGAFGVAICYDADDVQTTGLGVRPRPRHLDVEC